MFLGPVGTSARVSKAGSFRRRTVNAVPTSMSAPLVPITVHISAPTLTAATAAVAKMGSGKRYSLLRTTQILYTSIIFTVRKSIYLLHTFEFT